MRIPKNTDHNLTGWTLCLWVLSSAFTRLQPLCSLSIELWYVIIDHVLLIVTNWRKNSVSLRWNNARARFESYTRCYLWPIVRKRCTHRADNFFIPKCSCKIWPTRSVDIFTMWAISLTLILWSSETIRWPHLNSAYNFFTVVYNREDVP